MSLYGDKAAIQSIPFYLETLLSVWNTQEIIVTMLDAFPALTLNIATTSGLVKGFSLSPPGLELGTLSMCGTHIA